MSKKITHKEHRQLLSELYKKQSGKWIYQADAYIKQQEKLEKELDNTIIIANSRLERLNGLELEFDKQEKLLELYKEKDKLKDFFAMGSIRAEKYKKIEKQIKELENESEIQTKQQL